MGGDMASVEEAAKVVVGQAVTGDSSGANAISSSAPQKPATVATTSKPTGSSGEAEGDHKGGGSRSGAAGSQTGAISKIAGTSTSAGGGMTSATTSVTSQTPGGHAGPPAASAAAGAGATSGVPGAAASNTESKGELGTWTSTEVCPWEDE